MKNYIKLTSVLGQSMATEITVQLFNSVRPHKKDKKGTYLLTAIKPYLNGVIVEKQYL